MIQVLGRYEHDLSMHEQLSPVEGWRRRMGKDRSTQLLKPIVIGSALLITGTAASAAYSGLGNDVEAMCIEKLELCEFMCHVAKINAICNVYKNGQMTRTNFNQVLRPLFEQLTALDNYPGRQAIRELDSPNSKCYDLKEWKILLDDVN